MDLQPLAELAMSLQNANTRVMKNAAALQNKPSESPKFVMPGVMDGSRYYAPRQNPYYSLPQAPPHGLPQMPQMGMQDRGY